MADRGCSLVLPLPALVNTLPAVRTSVATWRTRTSVSASSSVTSSALRPREAGRQQRTDSKARNGNDRAGWGIAHLPWCEVPASAGTESLDIRPPEGGSPTDCDNPLLWHACADPFCARHRLAGTGGRSH